MRNYGVEHVWEVGAPQGYFRLIEIIDDHV